MGIHGILIGNGGNKCLLKFFSLSIGEGIGRQSTMCKGPGQVVWHQGGREVGGKGS